LFWVRLLAVVVVKSLGEVVVEGCHGRCRTQRREGELKGDVDRVL
jgi:hypothetical protein